MTSAKKSLTNRHSFHSPWPCTEPSRILDVIQQNNKEDVYDILGIVVNVSIDSERQKAHLLVTDASLRNAYTCARVTVGTVSSLQSQGIGPGDLIRINQLLLQKVHGQPPKFATNRRIVVCELRHSWTKPEAGVSWKRFCSIRGKQVVNCAENIPQHMATPTSTVDELVQWSCQQQQEQQSLVSPNQDSTTRRRCLEEITLPGMISHVSVHVLSCDICIPSLRKRRRRFVNNFATRTSVAMLSEKQHGQKEQCIMSLQDGKLAWESILKDCMAAKTQIQLTSLLSVMKDGNLVLVPTADTTVIPREGGSEKDESTQTSETQEPFSLVPHHHHHCVKTLESPLFDMYVNNLDVSLGEGKHWSNASKLLIDTKASVPKYRSVTLTLRDENGDMFTVNANAFIVEILCGSVKPSSDAHLFKLGMQLIKSLLEELLPMEWTLTHSSEKNEGYQVASVRIPRI